MLTSETIGRNKRTELAKGNVRGNGPGPLRVSSNLSGCLS